MSVRERESHHYDSCHVPCSLPSPPSLLFPLSKGHALARFSTCKPLHGSFPFLLTDRSLHLSLFYHATQQRSAGRHGIGCQENLIPGKIMVPERRMDIPDVTMMQSRYVHATKYKSVDEFVTGSRSLVSSNCTPDHGSHGIAGRRGEAASVNLIT